MLQRYTDQSLIGQELTQEEQINGAVEYLSKTMDRDSIEKALENYFSYGFLSQETEGQI